MFFTHNTKREPSLNWEQLLQVYDIINAIDAKSAWSKVPKEDIWIRFFDVLWDIVKFFDKNENVFTINQMNILTTFCYHINYWKRQDEGDDIDGFLDYWCCASQFKNNNDQLNDQKNELFELLRSNETNGCTY